MSYYLNLAHYVDDVSGILTKYAAMKYSYAAELATILAAVASDTRTHNHTISGQPTALDFIAPATGVTGARRSPFYVEMLRMIERGLAGNLIANDIRAAINTATGTATIPAPYKPPKISSSARPPVNGSTLTATGVAAEWLGTPTSFSYQWTREGVNIGGQTAATYTVVAVNDNNHRIGCKVVGINATGSSTAYATDPIFVPTP